MDKLKAIFLYAFTVDFLLKILIITVLGTLWGGHFTIYIKHSDLSVSTGYGGIEIKLKEPITIKPEIGGFELKRSETPSEMLERFRQGG